MKKIAIIASIGLTFVAAGTLTAGLISSNRAGLDSEVKANEDVSGQTYLSLFQSTGEWLSAETTKFGFYYYNEDDYSPKKEGWSTGFATEVDSTAHVFRASFEHLDFTPNKMIAVRYDKDATTTGWDSKWSQSKDLDFAEIACIQGWGGAKGSSGTAWTDSFATIKGLSSDIKLDSYKESSTDGNHGESYKLGVSLKVGDKFTVEHAGNTYNTPRVESHISSNFTTEDNKIKCLVSGTYDLFFNTSGSHMYGKQLWIETSAENAATAFANNFLTNFTCGGETGPDAGTVTAEEGTWGNLKTAWNALTDGSKSYFLNVKDNPSETGTIYQQVMARYKYVIEKYGTDVYEDFMGAGYTKKLSSNAINLVENSGNNYTAIIIIAVSAAVVSLSAAFIMLKKRKESR